MRVEFVRRVTAFALVLSLGTAAQIARAADAPVRGDFVGQLRGLDHGAIAISTDGERVLAYVCDGISTGITVAQWFKGTPSDNAISLVAGNAKLDVALDSDRASGTVALADGRTFTFRAVSIADADGNAGLFRSELDSGGHHYVAGWIEEPARGELQPAQLSFVDGWFDWSTVGVVGGIIDELRKLLFAPPIGPTTTQVSSSVGQLEVHRVRQGRAG